MMYESSLVNCPLSGSLHGHHYRTMFIKFSIDITNLRSSRSIPFVIIHEFENTADLVKNHYLLVT